MEIFNKLNSICKTKQFVDLKQMCSMHIGGIGDYVCYPNNVKQLKKLMLFLTKEKINYFVVGNGTNLIFEDDGYSGVLICIKELNSYKITKNKITAYAGLNLFVFNTICQHNGLGGMEWSYGIPGSVGGAICMNAGAYGSEIKEFIKHVWVLRNNKVVKLNTSQMKFGYRSSVVLGSSDIIIKATFVLKTKNEIEIKERQNQIFSFRKCCQPYGTFNAGSIFKKTNGESAGKTIDKLGLKGVKIGEIKISEMHANFFVNLGNGKSEDLHKLLNYTKQTVKEQTGIELEEEVIFVTNKRNKI